MMMPVSQFSGRGLPHHVALFDSDATVPGSCASCGSAGVSADLIPCVHLASFASFSCVLFSCILGNLFSPA